MSARSVAMRLSEDPGVQLKIEELLARNNFADRECEAVLLLTEAFLEGVREAGGEVSDEILLRAGARAVDSVWALRTISAREVAG